MRLIRSECTRSPIDGFNIESVRECGAVWAAVAFMDCDVTIHSA